MVSPQYQLCVVQVSIGKVGQLVQASKAVFGGHRWGSRGRWSCGGVGG